MATYRTTIDSPRSPPEVFDYMADFTNITKWDPTAVKAEALAGGEPGIGAKFSVLVRWLGREIPLEYEVTEYDRPGRLVLRAENSTTISQDTIKVVPSETGARMTYQARLKFKGFMRLLDPIFNLALKRLGDNAAAGLRRELGRPTQSE
jgi:hypothetical protein